ncbi:hypothetical protein [Planctomyces sp. SH-PL62]|uniref:hypothetical protein n=1 Tax=Planctomyces sp. SH-PL62 TaxID=1636152 RepID=UPI00078E4564|nr:hypothetical protein [Planctomyces sp. SH-PL62]AMV38427.1 hypothetical protein VT85_13400 [Planctomyces sp. SH-PL62]
MLATDGRQMLVQGGFGPPWEDDLLVRTVPLFACKGLPRDAPVAIGRTETHVTLRAGAWTLHPSIEADARFPRVEHAVPDAGSASTRLAIDPADAAFLAGAIDSLPSGDEPHAPATLDCNGRVAVQARTSRRPSWCWPAHATRASRSGCTRTASTWRGRSASALARSAS